MQVQSPRREREGRNFLCRGGGGGRSRNILRRDVWTISEAINC